MCTRIPAGKFLRRFAHVAMLGLALCGVALVAPAASANPMTTPSTGQGNADWDIDHDAVTTRSAASGALGDAYFHVEWNAKEDGHGHANITGYVYNDYGQSAKM